MLAQHNRFEELLERLTALADDEKAAQGPLFGTLARHSAEGRFRIAAALTALELHQAAADHP